MKWAILIGINYSNTPHKLKGCHNDVKNTREYLESQGFEHIIELIDNPAYLQPTRENILNFLQFMVTNTRPGNMLYIHFSGHGWEIDDGDSDELDSKDETICPIDYKTNGLITDDEINNIFTTLKYGASIRAVFDCCYSGTICDLPYRWTNGNKLTRENDDFERLTYNNSDEYHDIIVISGCRDNNTSSGKRTENETVGALTWILIESLKQIQDFDYLVPKYRWRDLGNMIRLKMDTMRFVQKPQLCFVKQTQLNEYIDI